MKNELNNTAAFGLCSSSIETLIDLKAKRCTQIAHSAHTVRRFADCLTGESRKNYLAAARRYERSIREIADMIIEVRSVGVSA